MIDRRIAGLCRIVVAAYLCRVFYAYAGYDSWNWEPLLNRWWRWIGWRHMTLTNWQSLYMRSCTDINVGQRKGTWGVRARIEGDERLQKEKGGRRDGRRRRREQRTARSVIFTANLGRSLHILCRIKSIPDTGVYSCNLGESDFNNFGKSVNDKLGN